MYKYEDLYTRVCVLCCFYYSGGVRRVNHGYGGSRRTVEMMRCHSFIIGFVCLLAGNAMNTALPCTIATRSYVAGRIAIGRVASTFMSTVPL